MENPIAGAGVRLIDKLPHILFIGPMLGSHPGWVPNPMEMLAPKLRLAGYDCRLTSTIVNRFRRPADILRTMWSERRRFDIACIQVFSGRSFIVEDVVSAFARRLGKRLVYVLHGGGMPAFIDRYPRWSRRVFRRAHVVVSPSAYLTEPLKRFAIETMVIPNHFEIESCHFLFRRRVKPELLWMRTFHPIYNPEMAVRALALLKQSVPDARLTMAGQEKGSVSDVHRLVRKLGIEDSVRFAGFLGPADKVREFARHDVFLNTNRIDNMPISVLEAMAFGLPVVSTDVGGLPHLVDSERTALLVKDDDPEAMTGAVLRLLGEDGLASSLSVSGRRVAENSSWEKIAPLWERAFGDAMECPDKRMNG
jgi:L-malate glycosyltransferase